MRAGKTNFSVVYLIICYLLHVKNCVANCHININWKVIAFKYIYPVFNATKNFQFTIKFLKLVEHSSCQGKLSAITYKKINIKCNSCIKNYFLSPYILQHYPPKGNLNRIELRFSSGAKFAITTNIGFRN